MYTPALDRAVGDVFCAADSSCDGGTRLTATPRPPGRATTSVSRSAAPSTASDRNVYRRRPELPERHGSHVIGPTVIVVPCPKRSQQMLRRTCAIRHLLSSNASLCRRMAATRGASRRTSIRGSHATPWPVDTVMPDASGLWLAAHAADQRTFVDQASGYEIWVSDPVGDGPRDSPDQTRRVFFSG